MRRSPVILLSWIVAIAFVLGTGLIYVDRFNLVATPPAFPDSATMIDHALGSVAYRQAIWPVYLWTNLLFAIGFVAAVPFAAAVASASGVAGGLPIFAALTTTGGIIAGIASIIPLGAVDAAVWLQYCNCGFKETEIISQEWAGMVAHDISDWFTRVASVILAVGLIALVREARAAIPLGLRTWTQITAIVLAVIPILATIGRFEPVPELATTVAGVVLIPIWAIWLGRVVSKEAPASG
jgi:hypothetical protein